jgi:hypothetical protein
MDEEGNLIGVKDMVDFDEREVAEPESMKLHNELLLQKELDRKNETVVVEDVEEEQVQEL